jgi:hypothetical protein
MLAYYVRWHLEQAWAPLLFRDQEPPLAGDPVSPAQRSSEALRKASTQQLTDDGSPVHSWSTLLAALATLTRNRMRPQSAQEANFELLARPTPLQARALALLDTVPAL